jgi:hypothetical protein
MTLTKESSVAKNKWILALGVVCTLGLSVPTMAHYDHSGVAIGAQFGYGYNSYNRAAFQAVELKEGGIAGRVYLANQFNRYVALELGAALYSDTNIEEDFGHIRTSQLDLLLRLGAPIPCSCFRADLKVGAVVNFVDIDPTAQGKALGLEHEFVSETRPAAGLSIAYNFTPNIAMDLSYLHVFGNPGSDSHPAPNNELATLGISYIFVLG